MYSQIHMHMYVCTCMYMHVLFVSFHGRQLTCACHLVTAITPSLSPVLSPSRRTWADPRSYIVSAYCWGTDRKLRHSRFKFNCETQSRTLFTLPLSLPLPLYLYRSVCPSFRVWTTEWMHIHADYVCTCIFIHSHALQSTSQLFFRCKPVWTRHASHARFKVPITFKLN